MGRARGRDMVAGVVVLEVVVLVVIIIGMFREGSSSEGQ
jgi:hypothetical protein